MEKEHSCRRRSPRQREQYVEALGTERVAWEVKGGQSTGLWHMGKVIA